MWSLDFVGIAYKGKDIVFRFIIEYSSLIRDFGPLGNNNKNRSILIMRIFERWYIFGLCWKSSRDKL